MSEIVTEEIKLPEANSPPVENKIEPVEGPKNETQTAENAEKPIEEQPKALDTAPVPDQLT